MRSSQRNSEKDPSAVIGIQHIFHVIIITLFDNDVIYAFMRNRDSGRDDTHQFFGDLHE
jgi:DNA-binding GntR family transcriptional regulator